ncbi:MAG: hypothetical protein AAF530_09495 [Pseudomonadota bacterium]
MAWLLGPVVIILATSLATPSAMAAGTTFTASAQIQPISSIEGRLVERHTSPNLNSNAFFDWQHAPFLPDQIQKKSLSSCSWNNACLGLDANLALRIFGSPFRAFSLSVSGDYQVRFKLDQRGHADVIIPATIWRSLSAMKGKPQTQAMILVHYE